MIKTSFSQKREKKKIEEEENTAKKTKSHILLPLRQEMLETGKSEVDSPFVGKI